MKEGSFHIQSTGLPDLTEMRRFVESSGAEMGAGEDAIGEMVLAVNEAVTNVLVHGYRSKKGEVDVLIESSGPNLIVRLRDNAPLFDPTTVPSPDITLSLDQRAPGGLGVHMMRQFTDELIYRVTSDGKNELLLIKRGVLPVGAKSPQSE